MKVLGTFEKARLYIESHAKDSETGARKPGGPCITISRETGSGAERIGEKIIHFFDEHGISLTLFDKNLIEKVLEENHLPLKYSQYFPEEKLKPIKTLMNEMLGIHPPVVKVLHKTNETILELCRMGYVIIVGRAANVISAKLPNAIHVRLVAPLEVRIKNMESFYNMTHKEAVDFIKKEDAARADYVRINYNRAIDDPTLYHLVLNMGVLKLEEAAEIIGITVLKRMGELMNEHIIKVE